MPICVKIELQLDFDGYKSFHVVTFIKNQSKAYYKNLKFNFTCNENFYGYYVSLKDILYLSLVCFEIKVIKQTETTIFEWRDSWII